MKKIFSIALLVLLMSQVFAQRPNKKRNTKTQKETQTVTTVKSDTIPQRTVVVTSAFKPTLKPTSKINFNGAAPAPDSTRPALQYDVPAQNISFIYQSSPLKPLAQNIDTALHWENSSF